MICLSSYFGSAKDLIHELAKLRNRVEHYAANINKRQAASIIARTVVFLDFFIRVELGKDFRQEIGDENWVALLSIDEYLGHAKREVEMRLKADNAPVFLCDSCNSNTATITERHSPTASRWKLHYDEIACLVCQKKVAYREECRRCSKTMVFIDATSIAWHSYCDNCKDTLKEEYPGLRLPEYADEARHWFQEHETITTAQLIDLLFNVAMFGSSRYLYVDQLVEQRLIDFVSEKDKELYYSSFAGGYRPEVTFKWIYAPHKVGERN